MRMDILTEVFRANGDSNTAASKKMGITKASLSRKMHGKNGWTLKDLQVLKREYGMTMQDLEAIFF